MLYAFISVYLLHISCDKLLDLCCVKRYIMACANRKRLSHNLFRTSGISMFQKIYFEIVVVADNNEKENKQSV